MRKNEAVTGLAFLTVLLAAFITAEVAVARFGLSRISNLRQLVRKGSDSSRR